MKCTSVCIAHLIDPRFELEGFEILENLFCIYNSSSVSIIDINEKNRKLSIEVCEIEQITNSLLDDLFGCVFLSKNLLCTIHKNSKLCLCTLENEKLPELISETNQLQTLPTEKELDSPLMNGDKNCSSSLRISQVNVIESVHNDKIVEFKYHLNILSILYEKNVLVSIELTNLLNVSEEFPLALKKWSFSAKVTDFYPVDPLITSCVSPLLYEARDHLNGNIYLCTGSLPTIGIYYSQQWKKKSSLRDAVALVDSAFSTAKSFISKNKPQPKKKPSISSILPCDLPLVQHFNDTQRIGVKICDVNGRFALIKDNLGRFLLFDIKGCVVLRIWKGFRDSDGFLFLNEEPCQLYCAIFSKIRGQIYYWKGLEEESQSMNVDGDLTRFMPLKHHPNIFFDVKNKTLFFFS